MIVCLAAAIHGNVNVLDSDGRLRQITTSGSAILPSLPPNARLVAYIRGTKPGTNGVEGPFTTWIVPISAADGAAYRFSMEKEAAIYE